MKQLPEYERRHAIVIGGSMTGLATAQVLSAHFERVTLVERDALPDVSEFRAGVPQGRQVHALLRRGQDIFERLFPGLCEELLKGGAENARWGRDVRWYHFGGWKDVNDSAFESLFSSRNLIEATVRRRLRQNPKITIRDHVTVGGLTADATKRRITGIVLEHNDEPIAGDLVADASGRESKAPEWLRALGFSAPEERTVDASLGYTSRYYKRPPGARAWKGMIIHPTPPEHNRIAAIFPIEGDRWHVVIGGVNCDYPPTDASEFDAFARSLPSQEFYEALKDAEPISPLYGFRRTSNRLRLYEKLSNPPERFVALGDAVCAFNPVYGQGMSTGAIGAELLGECLAKMRLDGLPPVFHRRLSRKLIVPWLLATSEDFRYPKTEGKRMPGLGVLQGYVDRLLRLSVRNLNAYDSFLNVMHMTAPVTRIMAPGLVIRALWGLPQAQAKPTTPATTP